MRCDKARREKVIYEYFGLVLMWKEGKVVEMRLCCGVKRTARVKSELYIPAYERY